jgi:ATPase family protein associated with various cellular activities (AAA)
MDMGPDVLVLETRLTWFLEKIHRLGGRWEVLSEQVEWEGGAEPLDLVARGDLEAVDPAFVLTTGRGGQEIIEHGCGVFRLAAGGIEVLAVSFRTGPRHGHHTRRFVALTGTPRARLAAFYRNLSAAGRRRRVTRWDTNGVPRNLNPTPVAEEDVILPPVLKQDLLGWLDRFWKLRDLAAAHGLPLHRGLLLVGAPGTGKTTLLKHLLTRYAEIDAHLFIPTRVAAGGEAGFDVMLKVVRGAQNAAIVVLEDIDRLVDSGAVTAAGLLNSLDGLLALDVPALWIATSNDPTTMERSLLDRPGRFDRTVVLPVPGPNERGALLGRCSTLLLDSDALAGAVAASPGLTGAHLREACVSATLLALDTDLSYGVALLKELERVKRDREAARDAHQTLSQERSVGFVAE